jgi:hypothetical protein
MILNEDENSITYQTPQGPLRVAKGGVSSDFMGQFKQASTINPNPQVSPETIAGTAPLEYEDVVYDPMTGYQSQMTLGTPPEVEAAAPPPQVSGDGYEMGQMSQADMVPSPAAEMSQPAQVDSSSKGMNRFERGLTKEANLAEEQGKQTAAYYDGMAKQMEQQAKDRQDREAQREMSANQHYEEMRQSQDQLAKMQPQDFWADKSTGSRIVAGLSVILGAVGGAMDGTGANQGADVIDKAIERDLKMQMLKRDVAKEGVEGKKSLYQMRMNQYKDKDMAEAAARSDMLQGVELQIKKMQASNAGPQAKAKLDQVLGEIQMKKESANAELAAKYAEAQQKNVGRFIPALGGFAPTEKEAQELRAKAAEVDKVKQGVDELLKISNTSNKSMSPELTARASVLSLMIQGALKTEILGPGAISDSDRAILQKLVADPTKINQLDVTARTKLTTLRNKIEDGFRQSAKSQGFMPQEQQQIKTTSRK